MKPVYINGPLRGQRFDVDENFVCYPDGPSGDGVLTYQFRKYAFTGGGRAVIVNIGWCGGPEPDVDDIGRVLFRDEVLARAEFITLPAELQDLQVFSTADWEIVREVGGVMDNYEVDGKQVVEIVR